MSATLHPFKQGGGAVKKITLYIHRWKAMDHGYLLSLSIHLAEIPTSHQNFASILGLK